MDKWTRQRGLVPVVIGIVAVAVSVLRRRLGLDSLAGLGLGIAIASFFLGFRASYRQWATRSFVPRLGGRGRREPEFFNAGQGVEDA